MGIQMTIPFTVLQNGAVSVETDTNTQIGQRVGAIVGTEIGQRAMRAGMGLPLSTLLFGVSDTIVTAQLNKKVVQQLNTYEPGINVLSVQPVMNKTNDGLASVQVNYAPVLAATATSSVSNVAIIEVGGTIKEVTLNGH